MFFQSSRNLRSEELGAFHPSVAFCLADMALASEDLQDPGQARKLRNSAMVPLEAENLQGQNDVLQLKNYLEKINVSRSSFVSGFWGLGMLGSIHLFWEVLAIFLKVSFKELTSRGGAGFVRYFFFFVFFSFVL